MRSLSEKEENQFMESSKEDIQLLRTTTSVIDVRFNKSAAVESEEKVVVVVMVVLVVVLLVVVEVEMMWSLCVDIAKGTEVVFLSLDFTISNICLIIILHTPSYAISCFTLKAILVIIFLSLDFAILFWYATIH